LFTFIKVCCSIAKPIIKKKNSILSGVLDSIFRCLYDSDVISEEAFEFWQASEDPAEIEGKGVAVKSTLQFYVWMKEASTDEDGSDEGTNEKAF